MNKRCICANCGARYNPLHEACPYCHEVSISGWEYERKWGDDE